LILGFGAWTLISNKFTLNGMNINNIRSSEDNPEGKNPSTIGQTQAFTPIDQHLFESRTIFVSGEVNSELGVKVNRQLLAMERANPTAPIVLWIDCPGGEVYSGFSIYDTVQFIKPKVITLVAGLAASMGSVIALAAEKENRLALPNSKLLIHQPLMGGMLRGSASDLEIHTKDIIDLKKKMHRMYADRTGGKVEKFVELMERDRWVEPVEAIELGLISKIIKSRSELDGYLK
jgi:ATP-dependent Clp protease protease subunit